MNSSQNAFFFEIQQIPEDSKIFEELKNQEVYFVYFQVNQKYYLFFYHQKSIDIDPIESLIDILDELDRKQRKIRSLRGFFLYVLEIMEKGEDYQILKTNLQPSFWRKLKNIIQQNKKSALQEFLFGSEKGDLKECQNLKEEIKELKDLFNSLDQKITDLQNEIENLKTLSEALKILEKASLSSEEYNLSSNPNQPQNESYFKSLKNIPEKEIIEIIERGFQLQAQGKISLKKYYQSREEYSLFQLKGYSIKYESIRRTKLYQKLKD